MAHSVDTSKIKTRKQKAKELDKAFEINEAAKSKLAEDYVIDANKGYKRMKE